ncbi:F-type conjugal transfer protein TrbB [Pantoea agglomerans]|uniref:F-type conjugal transfer protein TrbB n=1 Tax=Pantoea TaxID=53335 RepID=UPI00076B0E77|nr:MULTISPECIES: F-type conjugal transfer protein TrbB [Pantoea]AMG56195.1 conjugal transfer protein TrbB [Pantoea vagans]MCX2195069.1 F-type conjugal transfer protein TrbB [Pantoea agglomerans]WNK33419.1 F-type conjugal transfer protein TrbB [Pantoea agglomerans]WNK60665.1 F-type conjugal transfer protein TrbB [Pantoea agglomerans]WNK65052.1 F-type conjugal transfer protein TrbB [Pantoea agglomerans]
MKLNVLMTVLLILPVFVQASVASDIAALEQTKLQRGAQLPDFGLPGASLVRAAPVKPPRMMALSDGRQVNLNDYAVVVFMQRGCQYSAKFDPLLKSWADEEGIKVYPYTLDGYGDAAFPVALIPRKAGPNEPIAGEILTFFGNGLPIATPTTFMVNVNTNVAYPLFQGETDMGTMSQRLAQMIEADIDNLPPDTLGPVPSSASLTPQ